jgi:hypothetical protein
LDPSFLFQFFIIQKNDSIKGGTPEVLGYERTKGSIVRLGHVRIAIQSSIIKNDFQKNALVPMKHVGKIKIKAN